MFFKRQRTVPTGYAASSFLLTCFIIGLLILSLAFVYYTRQILQLNRGMEDQVPQLADLAVELPNIKESRLQDRLKRIHKRLLTSSRLSFIITDADANQVIIARRIDDVAIERKINAEFLFSVDLTFQTDLDNESISDNLRQSFENQAILLSQDVKVLIEGRGSQWLIVDEGGNQTYAVRQDKNKLNIYEGDVLLTPAEESKLKAILERMKKKTEEGPKPIQYIVEDREIYGYLYHGEADSTAIDQLPFVFTDENHGPQKWQIWGELVTAETASPEQYARAVGVVENYKIHGMYIPLQTNPKPRLGYLYHEKTRYYGFIVMPIVLVAVFSTFLIVGFLSYRRMKTFEQASIWGGLAKETAHQLGTPISSLMGWLELLTVRSTEQKDETATEIYANMQSDLARLQNITARFGKIGSYPQKTRININEVIDGVVAYFQKRLPNRSKQVEIRVVSHKLPEILANADLLQWVFENLIRNSLDAMNKENGFIEIEARLNQPIWAKNYQIVILYKDNGKGIVRKDRSKIFQPGMTTKKHGWGLGLTLVKRIIQEYHYGQIRLIETGAEGTIFEIVLPVETALDGKEEGVLTKRLLHDSRQMRLEEREKGG